MIMGDGTEHSWAASTTSCQTVSGLFVTCSQTVYGLVTSVILPTSNITQIIRFNPILSLTRPQRVLKQYVYCLTPPNLTFHSQPLCINTGGFIHWVSVVPYTTEITHTMQPKLKHHSTCLDKKVQKTSKKAAAPPSDSEAPVPTQQASKRKTSNHWLEEITPIDGPDVYDGDDIDSEELFLKEEITWPKYRYDWLLLISSSHKDHKEKRFTQDEEEEIVQWMSQHLPLHNMDEHPAQLQHETADTVLLYHIHKIQHKIYRILKYMYIM